MRPCSIGKSGDPSLNCINLLSLESEIGSSKSGSAGILPGLANQHKYVQDFARAEEEEEEEEIHYVHTASKGL